jgi:mRNA interferase MazF
VTEYIPDAGHLVWITLDPQLGHEQAGRRPFLVLSPLAYNAKTSLMVGVPVTSKRKQYPFQVELPAGGSITGVALADQLKSFDWRARRAEHAEVADRTTLRDVRSLIATFLNLR